MTAPKAIRGPGESSTSEAEVGQVHSLGQVRGCGPGWGAGVFRGREGTVEGPSVPASAASGERERLRGPSESGRPGSRLPVQGLHAGLPGAGSGAPSGPRGPPAARQSRARAPSALTARRRRRRRHWPVHGEPSPCGALQPPGSRSRTGAAGRNVPPRVSCSPTLPPASGGRRH